MNAPFTREPSIRNLALDQFDLVGSMAALRDAKSARNECWDRSRVAFSIGLPGHGDALDDEAAALDETAERLASKIAAAVCALTGLSADDLREVL